MASQGAIQLEVTIMGYSFSIKKENLSSLRVKRVIGDGANEFTLELFDETAYNVEALLSNALNTNSNNGNFPDIYVRYSAADDFGKKNNELQKAVIFTGVIYDYQLTFVGMSTMLSLEGLLSSAGTSAASTFWWFDKSTICWAGTQPYYDDRDGLAGTTEVRQWYVDGKSPDQYNNWQNNNDVCVKLDFDTLEDGTISNIPTVKINPTRIFRRIINKYNGSRLGYEAGNSWGSGGSGLFKVGSSVDESEWVTGIDCIQRDETAAQFINRSLCKSAIKKDGDKLVAGFQYFVDGSGHNFKCLNYTVQDRAKTITVNYGNKNSNVISFSLANIGALVMAGGTMKNNNISSIDLLYGEQANSYVNKSADMVTTIDQSTGGRADQNWWNVHVTPVKVSASGSKDTLDIINKNTFDEIEKLCFEATLTIWGQYSNEITPGKYIDLTINTLNNRRHYASGNYYIVEVVDEVSSSGYIQTLTLIKNTTTVFIGNKAKTVEPKAEGESDDTGGIITSYTPISQSFTGGEGGHGGGAGGGI
jgi:hypothetical protein